MARDPDSADCRQALLEIFTVNDRSNQFILENLDPRAWKARPPGRNTRTIAAIFTHVHNMRRKMVAALRPPSQATRATRPLLLQAEAGTHGTRRKRRALLRHAY